MLLCGFCRQSARFVAENAAAAQSLGMKIRMFMTAAIGLLAGSSLLGGCASSQSARHSGYSDREIQSDSQAWNWVTPAPNERDVRPKTHVNPGNAVVQPGSGYWVVQGDPGSDTYSRRDADLAHVESNPYQSWMRWPSEQRPSLNNRRTYTSSRSAERYVYPSTSERERRSHRSPYWYPRRHVR